MQKSCPSAEGQMEREQAHSSFWGQVSPSTSAPKYWHSWWICPFQERCSWPSPDTRGVMLQPLQKAELNFKARNPFSNLLSKLRRCHRFMGAGATLYHLKIFCETSTWTACAVDEMSTQSFFSEVVLHFFFLNIHLKGNWFAWDFHILGLKKA